MQHCFYSSTETLTADEDLEERGFEFIPCPEQLTISFLPSSQKKDTPLCGRWRLRELLENYTERTALAEL